MSKLEFKPQDRQSIDFAEEERKRVSKEGSVVHSEEILGVPFYDITGEDPALFLNYPTGIAPSSKDGITISCDVSKYKKVYIDFINASQPNGNSGCGTIEVDLTKTSNTKYGYTGITISSNLYHGFVGAGSSDECYQKYVAQINEDKNSITLRDTHYNFGSVESVYYGRMLVYRMRGVI